jgi:hypothetical protein
MTALEHWRLQKSKLIHELADSNFYDAPPVIVDNLQRKLDNANNEIAELEEEQSL